MNPRPAITLTPTGTASFMLEMTRAAGAANLSAGESHTNIANTGANGAPFLLEPGFSGVVSDACFKIYRFDLGQELISCGSCLIAPGQTFYLGAAYTQTYDSSSSSALLAENI